jgi:hypothetical protein
VIALDERWRGFPVGRLADVVADLAQRPVASGTIGAAIWNMCISLGHTRSWTGTSTAASRRAATPGFFIPRHTRQRATNTNAKPVARPHRRTGRPSRSHHQAGHPAPETRGAVQAAILTLGPTFLPVASHRKDAHSTQMCMHLN